MHVVKQIMTEWVIEYTQKHWAGLARYNSPLSPLPPPFYHAPIPSHSLPSREPKYHVHAAARVDDVAHPAHPQAEARLLERRLHFFPAEEPIK